MQLLRDNLVRRLMTIPISLLIFDRPCGPHPRLSPRSRVARLPPPPRMRPRRSPPLPPLPSPPPRPRPSRHLFPMSRVRNRRLACDGLHGSEDRASGCDCWNNMHEDLENASDRFPLPPHKKIHSTQPPNTIDIPDTRRR
jgi:hypothetical protein